MKSKELLLLALVTLILSGGWSFPTPIKNVKANVVAVQQEQAQLALTSADVNIGYGEVLDVNELIVSGSFDRVDLPIVDSSILGKQVLTFKAYKDRTEIKVSKTINVVDNVYPEFTEKINKLILDYAEEFDTTEFFAATDEIDGDLAVTVVEENLDIYTAGEYSGVAYATDSSGNTISHEYVIQVLEEPEPEPEPEPVAPAYSTPSVNTNSSYSYNGYGPGWCTWWVADQRANIGAPIPNGWGNAISWIGSASAQGYAVGYTPVAGSIIAWPGVNHVAYVESVNGDGTVTISEMGWNFQAYNLNRRAVSTSGAMFIY